MPPTDNRLNTHLHLILLELLFLKGDIRETDYRALRRQWDTSLTDGIRPFETSYGEY